LIFDEEPHKVYDAKVSGAPTIRATCFGEDNNTRLYKGEGTITFICFEPYAHTPTSLKTFNGKKIDGKYL
jgi:hypothetical protein